MYVHTPVEVGCYTNQPAPVLSRH